jgi:hypothetical protein
VYYVFTKEMINGYDGYRKISVKSAKIIILFYVIFEKWNCHKYITIHCLGAFSLRASKLKHKS